MQRYSTTPQSTVRDIYMSRLISRWKAHRVSSNWITSIRYWMREIVTIAELRQLNKLSYVVPPSGDGEGTEKYFIDVEYLKNQAFERVKTVLSCHNCENRWWLTAINFVICVRMVSECMFIKPGTRDVSVPGFGQSESVSSPMRRCFAGIILDRRADSHLRVNTQPRRLFNRLENPRRRGGYQTSVKLNRLI